MSRTAEVDVDKWVDVATEVDVDTWLDVETH